MTNYSRSSFFSGLPQAGPVTKVLCGLLLVTSVCGAILQRKIGIGVDALTFSVDAVLHLELWRLLTYPFVEKTPWGLMISCLVLWIFGRWYESNWGSRDFLRFFFAATLGAALLTIPLRFVTDLIMPFQDLGSAEGPGAAVDAMMVALVLNAPDSQVLFGFVLPVPAKNLLLLLPGIAIIGGTLTGASTLSMTLGGMLMGYLLVTGNWRPARLLARLQRRRRRRDGLYVVRPPDKHTLH